MELKRISNHGIENAWPLVYGYAVFKALEQLQRKRKITPLKDNHRDHWITSSERLLFLVLGCLENNERSMLMYNKE